MDIIYITRSISFTEGCEMSRRAVSEQRAMGFAGRKPTMPQVFTFEPIRETKKPIRRKRRTLKVLYPPGQVRRSLPTEKDMAKRILLLLGAIVLFQVYSATEEELSLPELGAAAKPVSAPVQAPFSVVLLATSPEAEANCTQQPAAAGDSPQITGIVRSCRM